MTLTQLQKFMTGYTPETLSEKSKGEFSRMTVRRALAGRGIDLLKAKAIAKALKVKLGDLI